MNSLELLERERDELESLRHPFQVIVERQRTLFEDSSPSSTSSAIREKKEYRDVKEEKEGEEACSADELIVIADTDAKSRVTYFMNAEKGDVTGTVEWKCDAECTCCANIRMCCPMPCCNLETELCEACLSLRVDDVCFYCKRKCVFSDVPTNVPSSTFRSNFVAIPRNDVGEVRNQATLGVEEEEEEGRITIRDNPESLASELFKVYIAFIVLSLFVFPSIAVSVYFMATAYSECRADDSCASAKCDDYLESVECEHTTSCECSYYVIDIILIALSTIYLLCFYAWLFTDGLQYNRERLQKTLMLMCGHCILYSVVNVAYIILASFGYTRLTYMILWIISFVLSYLGYERRKCILSRS